MIAFITAALLRSATPPATDKAEVTLAIGTGVENRAVVPFDEGRSPGPGDNVYAWMELKGFDGDSVQQVWLRDGNVVARYTLPVGSSHRWRSWSRHRVSEGKYEVRVLGADDSELAKQTFTVAAPQAH